MSKVRFSSTDYTSWPIVLLPLLKSITNSTCKCTKAIRSTAPAELLILTSSLVAIDFHALLVLLHLPTALFYSLLAIGNPLRQTTNLISCLRESFILIHPKLLQCKISIPSGAQFTLFLILNAALHFHRPQACHIMYRHNVTTVSTQFACVWKITSIRLRLARQCYTELFRFRTYHPFHEKFRNVSVLIHL